MSVFLRVLRLFLLVRPRRLLFLPVALLCGSVAAAQAGAWPADVTVRLDEKRQTVRRIEGKDLLKALPGLATRSSSDPAGASVAFVAAHRDAFRLRNAASELKLDSVQRDELGFQHVRFRQVFRGLEVAGCEMRFHYDANGALYLVSASHIPTPSRRDVRPQLDKAAAIRAVASSLQARPADWPASLKIWPSPTGEGILAYEVAAALGPARAWRVFVDARSGRILQRISMIQTIPSTQP